MCLGALEGDEEWVGRDIVDPSAGFLGAVIAGECLTLCPPPAARISSCFDFVCIAVIVGFAS